MKNRLGFLNKTSFEKTLFFLFIFLIPVQLGYHFWPSWAFVYGRRVDYLSPTIYFTDVIILFIFGLSTKETTSALINVIIKHKKTFLCFGAFIILNTLLSVSPYVTLIKWVKVLEMLFFAWYVSIKSGKFKLSSVYKTLYISALFVSLIGVCQFILGHTIDGPFYYLGERSFSVSTPGIALVTLNGKDFLRAYSIFPHPNALAGYLGTVLVLLSTSTLSKIKKARFVGLLIILICFILTFSITSFIAFVFIMTMKLLIAKNSNLSQVVIIILSLVFLTSLITPFVSQKFFLVQEANNNITERLDLARISGNIIKHKFWIGSGLNTFVISMTKIERVGTTSWLLQPVHNIFLLLFSETGIVGLLFTFFTFFKMFSKSMFKNKLHFSLVIIFILITGLTDHYWITIQQNLLTLSLLLGLLNSS